MDTDEEPSHNPYEMDSEAVAEQEPPPGPAKQQRGAGPPAFGATTAEEDEMGLEGDLGLDDDVEMLAAGAAAAGAAAALPESAQADAAEANGAGGRLLLLLLRLVM